MTQEKAEAKDFFGMKAKRESLGMTLKDVFALTRISVSNLEAIENGNFQALPVSIYAKNFIKIYAQVLDLDSKSILAGYEAYWKSPQVGQPVKSEQVPIQEQKEQKTVPERKEEQKKEEEPVPKKSSYKRIFIAAIFLIFIVAVVVIIFHEQQPQPKVAVNQPPIAEPTPAPPAAVTTPETPPAANLPVNPPAQPAQVSQPEAAVSPAPKEAIKPVPSQLLPQQQKSTIPVKASAERNVKAAIEKKEQNSDTEGPEVLVIKATEETWLKIKIDKNPPFQVLLKPGQAIKRKGTGFAIDVGNAGGVIINFNGKTIQNLGKSGEVRRLQLP